MSKQNELVQFSRGASGGGSKNLIINGGMTVAQRGTSSQITGVNTAYKTVDRFINYSTAYSSLVTTQSQSTDAPSGSGFSNSFKVNVDTAEAVPANGFIDFRYKSEAYDMQRLAYGTSSAKTMTLSFWVKSNVTGTYNISFYMDDANKIYNVSYTIDAAGTWEHKTVQVTGNTNSGQVFNNDNGVGLYVSFTLSAGTNYKGSPSTDAWGAYIGAAWGGDQAADIAGTASNYWQITGVQLEVNDTATDFEHRSYSDELAKCQRYYYSGSGRYHYGNYAEEHYDFPVTMRANPTVTLSSVPTGGSVNRTRKNWVTITGMGSNAGDITPKADAEL